MTKTARKPARKRAAPSRTKTPIKPKANKVQANKGAKPKGRAVPARKAASCKSSVNVALPASSAAPTVRPGTKTHLLISLLQRPAGATAEELMAAVGWQKHSVHGFLAGTVKKKLGLALLSEKQDAGPRRYRIVKEGE